MNKISQRFQKRKAPPNILTGVIRLGVEHSPWSDLYHRLIKASWPEFLGLTVALYLAVNTLFAMAYMVDPQGIQGAHPGSFTDLFFFSIQTLATIGYGAMYPQTLYTHILVAAEAFVGLLGVAMVTGLMFARVSRPTAKVVFSQMAVITLHNGLPTLMFRAANQRSNQILEGQVRASLLRMEVTQEGHTMRRFYDLKLVRSQSPIFALSWTVMHVLDEYSPLYEATEETLAAEPDLAIIVTLTGLDEHLSQTIHARHAYMLSDIHWNVRFTDIISVRPDGTRVVNYHDFHKIEPY